MIRLTIPLIGFALMSCAPAPQAPVTIPHPPTTCGVEHVIDLVGKTPAEILPDEIAKRSGAKSMRLISPDMAVTMDYREDRLNVSLDDKGVITRFYCG